MRRNRRFRKDVEAKEVEKEMKRGGGKDKEE